MNNLMRFLVTILIVMTYFTCSSERVVHVFEINRSDSIICINLDSDDKYDIAYTSSLFGKADVISLETTQESLLGSIDKMEIYDSLMLILDSRIRKGLFLFNKSGKFMKQIGHSGEGPGEYVHPTDFTIDYTHRIIYVLDRKRHKINSYTLPEGEYIHSVKIQNDNIRSNYIMYYNCKLYADAESHIDTNNDFMLREIDLKTGEQISCWLSNRQYNKEYHNRLGNNTFFCH